MKRLILLLLAAGPLLLSGCMTSTGSTCGFYFGVLKPPTMSQQSIQLVQAGGPQMGVIPSGMFAGPLGDHNASVLVQPTVLPPPRMLTTCAPGTTAGALGALPPGCTLEEMCREVEALKKRLAANGTEKPALPMPSAKD